MHGSDGHGITVHSRAGRVALIIAPVTCHVCLSDKIIYCFALKIAAKVKPVHMELNDWNSPTTKLLTLLNVSSAKSLKRKFFDQQSSPPSKLNKRRVPDSVSPSSVAEANGDVEIAELGEGEAGRDKNPGDVGTNEAADLSDTEGVVYIWSN